jgi:abhydrolase domain-containing protein 12
MAVAEHFAMQREPIIFAGQIMVAPFVDVPTLVTTYKIAGTIPILSPVAQYPVLFNFLGSKIRETWSTKTRIANYIRRCEERLHQYRVTLIHAEDDYDIPWHHTPMLFSHAVNASSIDGVEQSRVSTWKTEEGQDVGAAGRVAQWHTEQGVVSEYLLRYGLHDVIMGSPIVSLAVMDVFEAGNGLHLAESTA